MISRRHILQGGGALLAAGVPALGNTAAQGRLRLGLADITVRRELAKDFAATLNAARAIGYSHFGFRLGRYSAAEPSEPTPVEKAGLVQAAGLAIGPVRVSPLIPFGEQVEAAHAIGASELVLSAGRIFFGAGNQPRTPSLAEFDAFILELDAMGAQARKAGVRFAYHNHWFDSSLIEGIHPLKRIIARTNPRNVAFELDLAWAYLGGEDVLAIIRLMGPRLLSMHVKDIDKTRTATMFDKFVPPGDGEMDYARLLPSICKLTNALPVVETDAPADGLTAAARAFAFIANIPKG